MVDKGVVIRLEKRVVGNSSYWYIPKKFFNILDLRYYNILDVIVVSKRRGK